MANYLEVDGGCDHPHRLRVVPQHCVGVEAVLSPFEELFQARHTSLTYLLRQEVVFRYLKRKFLDVYLGAQINMQVLKIMFCISMYEFSPFCVHRDKVMFHA